MATPTDDAPRPRRTPTVLGQPRDNTCRNALYAGNQTRRRQPHDYNHCVGCGPGRGAAGAASHRATTTAMAESAMTRDDVVLAFRTMSPRTISRSPRNYPSGRSSPESWTTSSCAAHR
ncbi:DUF7715 family protein [Mycolicibacterium xanthum]|uniref:DUF7715 family protein n=1 Tax=Mycolicibacterium xanthum TaxID=2796469 RepID=UPI003FD79ABD